MDFPAALQPESLVARAAEAVRDDERGLLRVLDQIPVAAYVTDPRGTVTHFNQACIPFAGRQPVAHVDRWCVTWKLYTQDGALLPHDRCPMAVAITEKRAVRGVRAMAERPDGTRVWFLPFPTPVLRENQQLLGAVNLLADLADASCQEFLRSQADRCRRLAIGMDERTRTSLLALAAQYEQPADGALQPN